MKPQQGAAALLVVSVLLVAALMMSLGSYKSLFYQIKRANNQIEARQEHWRAEGGLECAYAINQLDTSITPNMQDYASCTQSQVTATQYLLVPTQFELASRVNNRAEIRKSIEVIGRSTGAIQTRSDLKLIGSYSITPEFVYPDTCISVRFQASVSLQGGFITKNPSPNLCDVSYITDTQRNGLCVAGDTNCDDSGAPYDYRVTMSGDDANYMGDNKMFAHDFVHDPNLDPFEAFFGFTRANLAEVKKDFVEIEGSVASGLSSMDSCADKVKAAFASSDKVWVVGDCDLKNGLGMSASAAPKLLVVENGLLSVIGSDYFPGTVYHLFTTPVSDMTSRWSIEVSATPYLGSLSATEKSKLTFLAGGAFKPVGGYVFDTPGGLSVFAASVDLEFDSASVPTDGQDVNWKKGSWNDR